MIVIRATLVDTIASDGDESGSAEYIFSAEIDSRKEGLNKGVTSFRPGEQPYILVFKSANVTMTQPICSAPSVSMVYVGSQEIVVSQYVYFSESNVGGLQRPFSAWVSKVWLGADLGLVSAYEGKVTAKKAGTAVLKVKYKTIASAYRLVGVPLQLGGEDEFEIMLVVRGVRT